MEIKEIAQLVFCKDNIVITAHTGPDGDAIGSVSALFLALKSRGKNVCAVLENFSAKLAQIPGSENILHELPKNQSCDVFISLDCGDCSRMGIFQKDFENAPETINIDHHISNNNYGTYNYVDAEASATSEIVYSMLKSIDIDIDKEIATALYAGILYDTGGFRHISTTSYTYYAASELIKLGADFSDMFKRLFYTNRYEETQITAVALLNIKREFGNRFTYTTITEKEMDKVSARLEDLDNIVNLVKCVEQTKIAAFFYQKSKDEFKLSLRSENDYDVNKIATKFGGGGHKNASGASFHCTLNEAVELVKAEVEKALNEA